MENKLRKHELNRNYKRRTRVDTPAHRTESFNLDHPIFQKTLEEVAERLHLSLEVPHFSI